MCAGLYAALILLTGCPPEFSDQDSCMTDADCFGDEVCNSLKVCVLRALDAPQPSIESFFAAQTTISSGEMVTLSWSIKDAVRATLSAPGKEDIELDAAQIEQGQIVLTFEETITYTLTAISGTKRDSADVTVTVHKAQALGIDSFTVDQKSIPIDTTITLSWTTHGAETLTLMQGENTILEVPQKDRAQGSTSVRIMESTTFKLTAKNVDDEVSKEVAVVVMGNVPSIVSFTATPQTFVGDEMVTLAWEVLDADEVFVRDAFANMVDVSGINVLKGSVQLQVSANNTYTLTAVNAHGSTSASVEVTVIPELLINSFDAAPTEVVSGSPSVLSWQLSGPVESVTITDQDNNAVDISGVPLHTNGNVQVSPTQDTTYTLTVNGAGGQVKTQDVEVNILGSAPVINSFEAIPDVVIAGGEASLSWNITSTLPLMLTLTDDTNTVYDVSTKTGQDTILIQNIMQATTFTLTASNASGMNTAQASITLGTAVSGMLSSSATDVIQGEPITLTWTTQDASSITLQDDQGMLIDLTNKAISGDFVELYPESTTTYTLTAHGFGGPFTAQVTVQVTPNASGTFTANTLSVDQGDPVTLTWTTMHTTSIELTATDTGGTMPVDLSGKMLTGDSITLSPSETTTYRFVVDNANGNPLIMPITITVSIPVRIHAFSSNVETVEAGHEIVFSWQTQHADSVSLQELITGRSIDLTGKSVDADSVTVRAQVSTPYVFSVTSSQGVVPPSEMVNVTVTPAPLLISEIHHDPVGTHNGRQWVEIYNSGDAFIDLSHYSLGAGVSDYTETTLALTGVLAPLGCMVVGGPVSDTNNGAPVYTQTATFDPPIPNGGTTAAGVGLFYNVPFLNAGSVPIDSVLFHGPNTNNLLNEAGGTDAEVSPYAVDQSIARVSLSDIFELQSTPSPGRCFGAITPSVQNSAPNEATGTLTFDGFGFDPQLMRVALGTQTLTSCTPSTGGSFSCDVAAGAQVGAVDLHVTQHSAYTDDGAGGPIVTPLASPFVYTVSQSFVFEERIADSDANFLCQLLTPAMALSASAGAPILVDASVFVAGVTDNAMALPAGVVAEMGSIAVGVHPYEVFSLNAVLAQEVGNDGTSAQLSASLTSATAQSLEAFMRYSTDGVRYIYCDSAAQNGSDDGWQAGVPLLWQ